MPHRFPHAVLATLLAVFAAGISISPLAPLGITAWAQAVTPDWAARPNLPIHRSTIAIDGASAVELTIASAADASTVERLRDASERTLRVFTEWLGPLATSELRVIDLPWPLDAPGASYPGVAMTRSRWLTPQRDMIAERALIAGLARQYWAADTTAADPWFLEGLVIYTATRGIHTVLEGRNFAAPRFLGGFVSFPLRAQLLSPSPQGPRPTLEMFDEVLEPADAPWRYASTGKGSAARRAAMALTTLERTIGWPAMQQALYELRARANTGAVTPELLAAVVAEQRGVSADWLARDVIRGSDTIDYAIDGVGVASANGQQQTMVRVRRVGSGVFAATDRPREAGPARSIAVMVRYEDGSESRTFVDGRDASTELMFESAVPASMVMLDPDGLMLVDADRSNNARLLNDATANRTGVRLVLSWMLWLQNVMLTYTAIA